MSTLILTGCSKNKEHDDFLGNEPKYESVKSSEFGVDINSIGIEFEANGLEYNDTEIGIVAEIPIKITNNSEKNIKYIEFQADFIKNDKLIYSQWNSDSDIIAGVSSEFMAVFMINEDTKGCENVSLKIRGVELE